MATRMQQRRGTAAQWTSSNPVLESGEIGFESDTNKFKIGDGVNIWSSLDHFIDANSTVNPSFGSSIVFEGATVNGHQTTLAVTDPTATRTITFPNATGTVALTSDISEISQDAIDSALEVGSGLEKSYDDEENTIILSVDTAVIQERVTNVSNTEIGYLEGVSSLIQEQLSDLGSLISDTQASVNLIDNTADIDKPVSNATDTELDLKAPLESPTFTGTISGITKGMVGLGNVDNTTDAGKPVSNATDIELDLKAPINAPTFTGSVSGITKAMVGLSSVNDTSDAGKPVSTAGQAALDLKANLAGPTFTGTVSGVTKAMVGLGDVDNTTDAAKPVSTAGQTALDFKAPLASPTFTGVPAAPTADAATNTTQVATTAFVRTEVANLVASAPGALDTLNELALALGSDAEFSTTVTNSLALKAPLASPTFTGTVSLPAAGIVFTDGTQAKEGVASRTTISQKTASYTLSALTERDTLIEVNSASGTTFTVPTNSAVAYPIGTSIDILQTGAGTVTVAGDGGVTVNATPGLLLRAQWSGATLFKRATDTWVLSGDLKS